MSSDNTNTSLVSQLQANQVYLNELMKQYENITQYLTYTTELKNTHTYLSSFLNLEHKRTSGLSDKMRNDVHKVRQRYIDTLNRVRRSEWWINTFQIMCAFVIAVCVSVMFFVDGGMTYGMFIATMCLCGVFMIYIIMKFWSWQSMSQDDFTKIDWSRIHNKPVAVA